MSIAHHIKAAAAALGLFAAAGAADAARPDESFTVIKAGKIITGAGEEIENGEIVVVDGKVRLVGRKLEYPASSKIIDASGETVIPGLIHLRARPDLPNYQTRSGVRGNLSASSELAIDGLDFKPFLENGFTSVAIYPGGIQVPGTSSVYHTAGSKSDRLLAVPGYVRMTMNSQPRDKGTLRDALKKAHAEIEKVDKARQEWETKKKEADAKKAEEAKQGEAPKEPPKDAPKPPEKPQANEQAPPIVPPVPRPQPAPQGPPAPAPNAEPAEFKPPEMDPAHRPFIDLIQKKAGAPMLMLELGKASDYVHAVDVLDEEKDEKNLRRFYFLGSFPGLADFNYVADKLAEAKASVAMAPLMHRMPNSLARYNLAGVLLAGGAEVSFVPTGDSDTDLETHRAKVADLARLHFERTDAIKAMTINPARLLGADKQIGSIEKGKLADLVFLDGDILDPLARVTRVMINGELVWKAKEDRR